ncbi:MAG: hypothetical protein ABI056_03320 [Caulobacteraceae bacterium]
MTRRGLSRNDLLLGVIVAYAAALGGCATPKELKRPIGRPTMARPPTSDPLPVYATPEPGPAEKSH